jgi:hypothetical protein
MPSRRDKIDLRKLALAIGLAALLPAFVQPVRAEVRVSGQADAVIVEAREASVEEVLAALRASFNLHYRTSGTLNRVMTGTYTGSLQRVIARLLEGHNYVMQSSAGGGELIVVGPGETGSSVSASRRMAVADASHQKLPGPPLAPPLPNANRATQGPAGVQASPGLAARETLMPPLVGRKTSSDTTAQAMPPLPNATPGVVMVPVPTATAAGDVPAFPAVNTSLMPPPAPNPDFSFGPPIISLPAGFPIPPPAPGGAARP